MPHFAAICVALGAALIAGRLQTPAARVSVRFSTATWATCVIVAALFAAQLAVPSLLPLLARDPSMWQGGQLWRAISALFVQDYGVVGALVNLAALLIVGSMAEKRLGSVIWLVVYFGGGVVTEFLALMWQPHGAGNSIACFALAGALTLRAIERTPGVMQLFVCIAGMTAAVALLLLRDIHGLGYWAGIVCLFIASRLRDLNQRGNREPPHAREAVN